MHVTMEVSSNSLIIGFQFTRVHSCVIIELIDRPKLFLYSFLSNNMYNNKKTLQCWWFKYSIRFGYKFLFVACNLRQDINHPGFEFTRWNAELRGTCKQTFQHFAMLNADPCIWIFGSSVLGPNWWLSRCL